MKLYPTPEHEAALSDGEMFTAGLAAGILDVLKEEMAARRAEAAVRGALSLPHDSPLAGPAIAEARGENLSLARLAGARVVLAPEGAGQGAHLMNPRFGELPHERLPEHGTLLATEALRPSLPVLPELPDGIVERPTPRTAARAAWGVATETGNYLSLYPCPTCGGWVPGQPELVPSVDGYAERCTRCGARVGTLLVN